ncbi:hypothetical protein L596_016171 [Steinernema carpocapsae]|uniref:MH1 domain-containing protein n=1 Tax=Steinernema carpocapsae TaxID=34508 RepID=A0A4U5NH68_STECR|nr:hypothetical protein L596_016171 [Steinernema carpocapsae]
MEIDASPMACPSAFLDFNTAFAAADRFGLEDLTSPGPTSEVAADSSTSNEDAPLADGSPNDASNAAMMFAGSDAVAAATVLKSSPEAPLDPSVAFVMQMSDQKSPKTKSERGGRQSISMMTKRLLPFVQVPVGDAEFKAVHSIAKRLRNPPHMLDNMLAALTAGASLRPVSSSPAPAMDACRSASTSTTLKSFYCVRQCDEDNYRSGYVCVNPYHYEPHGEGNAIAKARPRRPRSANDLMIAELSDDPQESTGPVPVRSNEAMDPSSVPSPAAANGFANMGNRPFHPFGYAPFNIPSAQGFWYPQPASNFVTQQAAHAPFVPTSAANIAGSQAEAPHPVFAPNNSFLQLESSLASLNDPQAGSSHGEQVTYERLMSEYHRAMLLNQFGSAIPM